MGAVVAWALAAGVPAIARFGAAQSIGANTISTATLEPATGLGATAACDGPGTAKVTLSWTATASSFADGSDVYRGSASGGPYTNIAHVTGRTTTTFADTGLTQTTTYYYVIQATANSWTSVNTAQAQATTPTGC
jgi:cellulose 1,4-beta-cellobiosidase